MSVSTPTLTLPTPTLFPLALMGMLVLHPSIAAERDLGSHEHGAATLGVIIDASNLYLEFESPWNNLVGFEHVPSTDEQRAAVDSAIASLESLGSMFRIPESAGCTQSSIDVVSGFEEMDSDEHGDDAHSGEHADEEHSVEHADDVHSDASADEEHSEEHDDERHSDEQHTDAHSEVMVSYVFECTNMESLDSVTVGLLDSFPDIEDLDVEMAGPGGQSAVELGGGARVLELDAIR